jgi:hypothetical protein
MFIKGFRQGNKLGYALTPRSIKTTHKPGNTNRQDFVGVI